MATKSVKVSKRDIKYSEQLVDHLHGPDGNGLYYTKNLIAAALATVRKEERDIVKNFHLLGENIPCSSDCVLCGYLACPNNEPLHFDKDGCPVCSRS
jgi:hypothetical protein